MPSSGSPGVGTVGGSPPSCVALRSLCAGDSPLWPGLSLDRETRPHEALIGGEQTRGPAGRGQASSKRPGEGVRYGKWPPGGLLLLRLITGCFLFQYSTAESEGSLPTWTGPSPPHPAATDSQPSSWGPVGTWGCFLACHSLGHRLGPQPADMCATPPRRGTALHLAPGGAGALAAALGKRGCRL